MPANAISVALLVGLSLQAEIPAAPTPAPVAAPATAPVSEPAVEVTPNARPDPTALDELSVLAPEPRYVAPTLRDRIGRIWAPVLINGQGPFRLVLDTGASHSALTAKVAETLGISLESRDTVRLLGTTGVAIVPMIPIETLEVGELLMEPRRLPIVPDALGGAEGILGTDGLGNKRIHIDFRKDSITIMRSRNQRADVGFITIPVTFMRGRLLVVDAWLSGIRVKAVIDTGGQATLGNLALRNALTTRRRNSAIEPDEVTGATLDVQFGERIATPSLALGDVLVRSTAMTFADFEIFQHWKMTEEPAVLVGMDVLGLVDTLIIDYRRKELQVRLRRS